MPKRILLTTVPDHASLWQTLLPPDKYALDVVYSARETVQRAAAVKPDLVVIDASEIPGESLVGQLRQQARLFVPVISITLESLKSDPDAALRFIQYALIPRRILIAEDDRQLTEILAMLLTTNGYEVRVAHDGVQTLKDVRSWLPDLLVLDIMLPGIDGFHICQAIDDDPTIEPRPKVIIVSGRGSDWDQNLGAACGAEHYFVKPLNHVQFLEKVRELLGV